MQLTQISEFNADRLRQAAPVITLVVMMIFVGVIAPGFLTLDTMVVLATSTATLFVLAAGQTFVIMLGGIDLSIQSIASMCSVILALALTRWGWGYLGFVVAVSAGLIAGIASGVAHVRLRIPSFISTLAAGGVWAAVALILSNERAIAIGGVERDFLTWITGNVFGVPNEVIIGAVVLGVSLFLQRFTPFGRYSAAIGAGEAATWSSGVRVNQYKVIAFAISGTMAGLAGVILAGRLSSGSPTLAGEFLLPAIAAVIVGGTAITGGVGSVWRTLIGALTISVIRVGMTFIGVDIFAQQIIFGMMLVIAVAITIDRSKIPIVK